MSRLFRAVHFAGWAFSRKLPAATAMAVLSVCLLCGSVENTVTAQQFIPGSDFQLPAVQIVPRVKPVAEPQPVPALYGTARTEDTPGERDGAPADGPLSGTLHWKEGDELSGRVVGGTASRLKWQSPALAMAFTLDWNYLESIDFAGAARDQLPDEPFRISLAGGDILFGNVTAITPEHVMISSKRHGESHLRRDAVLSLVRLDHADLIQMTLDRRRGWQAVESAGWQASDDGLLMTDTAGSRLFREIELPTKCYIDVELAWKRVPGFTLAYGSSREIARHQGVVWIETWGDELIVQTSAGAEGFHPLLTLTRDMKQLRLRLLWDRPAGTLLVHDGAGKLLARIPTADTQSASGGLYLKNKGADLTASVRLGEWEGDAPPKVIDGPGRVRLASGEELTGSVRLAPDAAGMATIAEAGGQSRQVPLAEICEISPENPAPPAGDNTRTVSTLHFNDGTRLHGRVASIEEGTLRLETSYSAEPLAAKLEGVRSMRLPLGGAPAEVMSSHVLEIGGVSLHGMLAAAGESLGWRPIGADEVIPLARDRQMRITRINAPAVEDAGQSKLSDILYLRGGDHIPCQVVAIDETEVHVVTPYSADASFPQTEVKAIELATQGFNSAPSFRDPAWNVQQQQADAAELTDREALLRGQVTLFHPELLRAGSLEFDLEWAQEDQQTYLYITLFTSDGIRRADTPMLYLRRYNQGQLIVQTNSLGGARAQVLQPQGIRGEAQRPPGAFVDRRAQVLQPQGNPGQDALRTHVKIDTDGEHLSIEVDGNQMAQHHFPDPEKVEAGISFQLRPINQVVQRVVVDAGGRQRVVQEAVPQNGSMVKITNLRRGRALGPYSSLGLDETEVTRILTVPRNRKPNPPRHMLVAHTGDLLRGELMSLSPEVVRFRSRLEELSVPRDRIGAIIWLTTETDQINPPPENAVQAVFENGAILQFTAERVVDGAILGQHPVMGKCSLPLESLNELRIGQTEPGGDQLAYASWSLLEATEPIFPNVDPAQGGAFGTYSPLVDTAAADFTAELLAGGKFNLAEHRGKVVVLDFWATWCGPCVQAMPQLTAAVEGFDPDEVVFIGVNQRESAQAVRQFMQARGWDFPVAMDHDGAIGRKYQVEAIPQTVVLNKEGQIKHVHLGTSPNLNESLTAVLQQLVSGDAEAALPPEPEKAP
ncbi:MAG: TlpA disulfide reductase family protein [Pirellulales bacterium]